MVHFLLHVIVLGVVCLRLKMFLLGVDGAKVNRLAEVSKNGFSYTPIFLKSLVQ